MSPVWGTTADLLRHARDRNHAHDPAGCDLCAELDRLLGAKLRDESPGPQQCEKHGRAMVHFYAPDMCPACSLERRRVRILAETAAAFADWKRADYVSVGSALARIEKLVRGEDVVPRPPPPPPRRP